MLKKYTACLLAVIIISVLTACGSTPSAIRYDVSQAAQSLDPQFAEGETEQLVIYNIFEGLVRQMPSGKLEPSAAQSYETSDNGLTYTFHLRPGMRWDDEAATAVTAKDFVFAFQRIFNKISPSPYSSMFSALLNADEVLAGGTSVEKLGVEAVDDLTLRFRLSFADPSFIENLSHSSAMPCNRALFDKANGKYGASVKNTPANGPFQLMSWDHESRIYLKRSENYYDVKSVETPAIYLLLGRDLPAKETPDKPAPTRFDLVMDGKSDGCLADYTQAQKAMAKGLTCENTEGTVWALVFNQNHPALGNEKVRQGFARAINRDPLEAFLRENHQDNLRTWDRLVPPAITLFTEGYTALSSLNSKNSYLPDQGKQLFREGQEELGGKSLGDIQLLVPNENNLLAMCGVLQQTWQQNLSVSVNVAEVTRDELSTRLKLGDYQMALVPLTASANSPADVLRQFTSADNSNTSGYANPSFDTALATAATSHNQKSILENYAAAETVLMDSATAIPLLVETTYFIVGKDVSGIEFYPYGGKVYFKNAQALR